MAINALGNSSYLDMEQYYKELAGKLGENVLAKKDDNKDGSISVQESGLSQTEFDSVDKNEDGSISSQELLDYLIGKLRENGASASGSGDSGRAELQSLVNSLLTSGDASSADTAGLSGVDTIKQMLGNIGLASSDISAIIGLLSTQGINLQG